MREGVQESLFALDHRDVVTGWPTPLCGIEQRSARLQRRMSSSPPGRPSLQPNARQAPPSANVGAAAAQRVLLVQSAAGRTTAASLRGISSHSCSPTALRTQTLVHVRCRLSVSTSPRRLALRTSARVPNPPSWAGRTLCCWAG
jgi:hypothetical protein